MVCRVFLKTYRMYLLNNMFSRLHYATLKSITPSIVQCWKRLFSKTMEFMNFRAWRSPNAFITRIVCSIFSKVIVFKNIFKNWEVSTQNFQKIIHVNFVIFFFFCRHVCYQRRGWKNYVATIFESLFDFYCSSRYCKQNEIFIGYFEWQRRGDF